jgi:hypothetical protein
VDDETEPFETERTEEMPTNREYVLTAEGAIKRRQISEEEIDVSAEIVQWLARDTHYRIPRVWNFENIGMAGVAIQAEYMYWTIELTRLIMRAAWHPGNNMLVPNFGSKSDPVLTVTWTPPADCRLKFITLLQPMPRDPNTWLWGGSWLLAQDKQGILWRLPMANVHDDGSCCTGMHPSPTDTSCIGLLMKIIQNFDNANYNADLWKNSENTQRFFRVKQVDDKFTSLAPESGSSPWSIFCLKVASALQPFIL